MHHHALCGQHKVYSRRDARAAAGCEHGVVPEIEALRSVAHVADRRLNREGSCASQQLNRDAGAKCAPILRREDGYGGAVGAEFKRNVAPRLAPGVAMLLNGQVPLQPAQCQPPRLLVRPPCCGLDNAVVVEHARTGRFVLHLQDAPAQFRQDGDEQVLVFQHQGLVGARFGRDRCLGKGRHVGAAVGPIIDRAARVALERCYRVGWNCHCRFVEGNRTDGLGCAGRSRRRCGRRCSRPRCRARRRRRACGQWRGQWRGDCHGRRRGVHDVGTRACAVARAQQRQRTQPNRSDSHAVQSGAHWTRPPIATPNVTCD